MTKVNRFLSRRVRPTIAFGVVVLVSAGVVAAQVASNSNQSPWTAENPLTIGVFIPKSSESGSDNGSPQPSSALQIPLPNRESYDVLAQQMKLALEEKLNGEVVIKIDAFEPSESSEVIGELTKRIQNETWDIAFTTIPTVSVIARDNDYAFAARMFPDAPRLNYVLFVRKDSPIQSIQNLSSDTTIALGELSSELTFYFPVYDLFGTALTAEVGNIVRTIPEKVGRGQIDIGVGIAQLFDTLPMLKQRFRIIKEGRSLPLSGVYMSPSLIEYHDLLQETLLSMPDDVQQAANYAAGNEPDYQYMEGVARRAQEIIGCRTFTPGQLELVRFYCDAAAALPSAPETALPPAPENGIVGRTEGYDFTDDGSIAFKLQLVRPSNDIYTLVIPKDILTRDSGLSPSPQAINGQYVHVEIAPSGSKLNIEEKGQAKLVQWP